MSSFGNSRTHLSDQIYHQKILLHIWPFYPISPELWIIMETCICKYSETSFASFLENACCCDPSLPVSLSNLCGHCLCTGSLIGWTQNLIVNSWGLYILELFNLVPVGRIVATILVHNSEQCRIQILAGSRVAFADRHSQFNVEPPTDTEHFFSLCNKSSQDILRFFFFSDISKSEDSPNVHDLYIIFAALIALSKVHLLQNQPWQMSTDKNQPKTT